MTAEALIERARADGVGLMLTPAGTLKLTGEQEKVHRWLGVLRQNKSAIAEALRAETAATSQALERTPPERPLLEDERTRIRRWLELIGETDAAAVHRTLQACENDAMARNYFLDRAEALEERAAVIEFDGGLPRQDAERLAREHPFVIDDAARTALRAARQAFDRSTPRP